MKKTLFIIILLALSSKATGQDYIDLVKFDYTLSSPSKFDAITSTTKLRETNASLTLPIKINDHLAFLTGVSYENTVASFDPGRKRESLTGLGLRLGVNFKHNSKWSGTYMLLPQISSDLENISSSDLQLGAAILMKYAKTKHFKYKFGVIANNEQFGPVIVPVFGFYYQSPSKKIEANLLLPISVDLNYSIGNAYRLGLNYKGQIKTYNLSTPVGKEVDRYLTKSNKEIYSYFQYEIKNGVNIQLQVGRSIGRSFSIYQERVSWAIPLVYFGDDRKQLNNEFSDSWLFKAAIFYRLQLG